MVRIVVDLEATCWSASEDPILSQNQATESEIIEIGAVAIDDDFVIVDEFCSFIRPVRHPSLSNFCSSLTSISQQQVDQAPFFSEAYLLFLSWINDAADVEFFSWGRYDHKQLTREALANGFSAPTWRPCNVKIEFSDWYRGRHGLKKSFGMSSALHCVGETFQGSPHRGIDDARNLVAVLRYIRDPANCSAKACALLQMMSANAPCPVHVGHVRKELPDAAQWFSRVAREVQRLGLASDLGNGRGLVLTPKGVIFQSQRC